MRKIIISICIVILIVIAYLMIWNNFSLGQFTIKNVEKIKELDDNLDTQISIANQKTSQEYVSELETLKTSIKNLVTTKEKYEKYNAAGKMASVQLKAYKVEYLWTIIGQYAKNRNTLLTLDLATTPTNDLYDLNFTLIGDYTDIVDFLSDLEKDDAFSFKITNFQMKPYTNTVIKTDVDYVKNHIGTSSGTLSTTTTETMPPYSDVQINKETQDTTVASSYNPRLLIAAFQIQDVEIEFN